MHHFETCSKPRNLKMTGIHLAPALMNLHEDGNFTERNKMKVRINSLKILYNCIFEHLLFTNQLVLLIAIATELMSRFARPSVMISSISGAGATTTKSRKPK